MKFPKEVNAYCPFCKGHKAHKVKLASKGRPRTVAKGNRAHNSSLMGHGGKRAGEKTVKKQGKRQKVSLICPECKKKHERIIGGRTTRKLELRS